MIPKVQVVCTLHYLHDAIGKVSVTYHVSWHTEWLVTYFTHCDLSYWICSVASWWHALTGTWGIMLLRSFVAMARNRAMLWLIHDSWFKFNLYMHFWFSMLTGIHTIMAREVSKVVIRFSILFQTTWMQLHQKTFARRWCSSICLTSLLRTVESIYHGIPQIARIGYVITLLK